MAFNKLNEMIYTQTIKIESVKACFCGGEVFRVLSKYDRFGLPFGTKICKSCGLITQTLRIHPESLAIFYEKIYWPLVSGQDNYLTPTKQDEQSSYIFMHMPSTQGDIHIFEVGCGSGERASRLAKELNKPGREVTVFGCDYSSDALELAKKRGVQVIHGGMEELVATGKADILILSHVFEHFPDLNHAMELIEKLCHDDSLIYIEVPGVIDLENKSEYSFNYQTYCVLAHTYNFSLSTLAHVMSSRGFTLVTGDEYVRAVFKKGKSLSQLKSGYKEIMDSLNKAYEKQTAFENRRKRPLVKYLRNIAKALLSRAE